MDEPAFVPLFHNDEEVEGVNVDEIDRPFETSRTRGRSSVWT